LAFVFPPEETVYRTAAATEAVQQYAAERAIDDPAKLARAARIVRAALARKRLTIAELEPDFSATASDLPEAC
jgi:hypothetical protein